MRKTRTLLLALSLGLGMNAYADDPPADWIIHFEDGAGGERYIDKVEESYSFAVEGDNMGKITFNSKYSEQSYSVNGLFALEGKNFVIDNSGANVTFTQPLQNSGTSVTLKGSGEFTTGGAAAFANIKIDTGCTLNVSSQIGVLDQFTIGSNATLNLNSTGYLLLTNQLMNDGTININGGKIDASNITHAEAGSLGIRFEDLSGKHDETVRNGFLYGDEGTVWSIVDSSGQGSVSSENGKLVVGTLVFDLDKDGMIHHSATDYTAYFQTDGPLTSFLAVQNVSKTHNQNANLFLKGGTTDARTSVNMDAPTFNTMQVYVAQGSNAQIDFADPGGSMNTLKLLQNSTLLIDTYNKHMYEMYVIEIESLEKEVARAINKGYGSEYRTNNVQIVGQNVQIETKQKNGCISPFNLLVNSASSVVMGTDLIATAGYMTAQDGVSNYQSGDYTVRGALIIGSGNVFDITACSAKYWSTSGKKIEESKWERMEEYIHLKTSDGGMIVLQENASLRADMMADGKYLFANDEHSLDTSRYATSEGSSDAEEWITSYTKGADMEISGRAGDAQIYAADEHNETLYSSVNDRYTVENAVVVVKNSTDNVSIRNEVHDSDIINQGTHRLTMNSGTASTVSEHLVYAESGDIAFQNKTSVNAETVHLGAGREVSVSPMELLSRDGSLTVTELLKADGSMSAGYSKIGANLELASGAELDVSAAGGTGGLNLTGALTINEGAKLSADDMNVVWAMQVDDKYDLAFGVTDMIGFEDVIDWSESVDASTVFNNGMKEGEFYICYSGTDKGGNGSNVGAVYLFRVAVPEPTTGTLSLLALAGLAARRRRK